ncbi:MAG: 4Fe-4S dicluster domain-containing protein [Lachnospiraceae bacterium]|nr:4Fe-4S dicluster domain-containing protein [Lachnospiraceae bacterium]
MRYNIEILRRQSPEAENYTENIIYDTDDVGETVANMLRTINSAEKILNNDGKVIEPISYEHSCMQKKCGACAMVINKRPMLACDAFLNNVQINGHIRLEPLKKFPVVRDLIVDRSIMMENLKAVRIWAKQENITLDEETVHISYEAATCLQCGCCLEVCPNFVSGDDFVGAAGFVPAGRLLTQMTVDDRQELADSYKKHVYKTCAKSLACNDICPAGIDIEHVLSASNAVAIWNRLRNR